MSNHASQKTLNTHHTQVNAARLRKLQRQYQREHEKAEYRRQMRAIGIAWEVFKAVYVACLMTVLVSSAIWAIGEIYGF